MSTKIGKEGTTCALVFHYRIYNIKNIFCHKVIDHNLQILVDCSNVLVKDLKGQVANSSLNNWHPLHMNAFKFAIKQRLESPKADLQ